MYEEEIYIMRFVWHDMASIGVNLEETGPQLFWIMLVQFDSQFTPLKLAGWIEEKLLFVLVLM